MSDRLDHSLFVSVRGCTGMILSGFQICSIAFKQKQNNNKKILMFQVSDTKWYLKVYFPCNVTPSLLSPFLTSVSYSLQNTDV